ncbi:MAG: hypothetical protein H0X26_10480 [Alphaproteobacteria bacterium]|nr:hypothetical protein [Alphaproteobacteria bacterium]
MTTIKDEFCFFHPRTLAARKKWWKICEDWAASGLSARRFCKENKISGPEFVRWRQKINFPFAKKPQRIITNWDEIIEDWEKTGLSVKRYCEEKGISPFGLYERRKKVKHPAYTSLKTFSNKWRAIVTDREKSGLNKYAYCKFHNLTPSALYNWDKHFNPHNIRKPSHEEAVERWTKILEDWKESNLSPKIYCREKKLDHWRLVQWSKRLNFPIPLEPEKIIYNWEEVSKDLQASGLSISRYCEGKGIPLRGLYRWEKERTEAARIQVYNRWKERVKDWEVSGLTAHAYCKLNGLDLSSFNRWDRHFNPYKIRRTIQEKAIERWTKILEDCKESGLSKFTYCKREGLTVSVFYKWLKKLNFTEPLRSDFTRHVSDIRLEDHFISIPFSSADLMRPLIANKKMELILPQGHQLNCTPLSRPKLDQVK